MMMPRKCTGPTFLSMFWKMVKASPWEVMFGKKSEQTVKGEILIWCRKCSGYARQRMGPKLMNCCEPEQVGTKEYGKMSKRIKVLEDGRGLAKEARNWGIEGQKRRITRKEYQRFFF